MSRYQKFVMQKINRSNINEADYNPRIIKDENLKKIKQKIKDKDFGLVQPLIYNKQTGNLVSGHQRLKVLDELEKTKDYELDVAVIDVPEEKEIEINIFLNNQSAMGEWDLDSLKMIKDTFPDLNYEKDFGFTKIDLDFFGMAEEIEKKEVPYEKKIESLENFKESFDNWKKQTKENENKTGISAGHPERSDYCLTIVFNNNQEKWDFMRNINKNESEKFIKIDDFIEFIREEYRI